MFQKRAEQPQAAELSRLVGFLESERRQRDELVKLMARLEYENRILRQAALSLKRRLQKETAAPALQHPARRMPRAGLPPSTPA